MKLIFIAILILASISIASAMGNRTSLAPMRPNIELKIESGETLRYKIEDSGDAGGEFKFILILTNISGRQFAEIFHDGISYAKKEHYPDSMTNYLARFRISTSDGVLEESGYGEKGARTNAPPFGEKIKEKTIYWKSVLNRSSSIIFREIRTWDGMKVSARKDKIPVKPGYPILDLGSGMIEGIRFLDIKKPGIAYFVVPEIIKEPLPLSFRIIGREKIVTPAGTFDTIKIGFLIADSFLERLMQKFTQETVLWIEDSDRRLVIKMKNPMNNFILEEIGHTGSE